MNALRILGLAAAMALPALSQTGGSSLPQSSDPAIQALIDRLTVAEARIRELEAAAGIRETGSTGTVTPPTAPHPSVPISSAPISAATATEPAGRTSAERDAAAGTAADAMAHSMDLLDGPQMRIRGFFDFNFGTGSIANPLIFPVSDNGCGTCGNPATPAHSAFQAGEFDLFLTSRLSDNLTFLSEVVLGPDTTNAFGPDIERYELTYQPHPWFSASAGRFHTSIGYYNTAYHHGNWFSTAEGRPIMYLFEDSGGILPVHMVGLSLAGEVPRTAAIGLHWVAEMGNGNSSNPTAAESGGDIVQNFYSDRNYKATNFAAYIKPRALAGLQIGGSWYHDGLNPSQAQQPLPLPEIRQNIASAYIVYLHGGWELLNEAVLLSNRLQGTATAFRSPMAYTQMSRKFGIYTPYFRYQYVHDNVNDPVNLLRGLYYGPSVGMRADFFDYAAFKLQYNHLFQSSQLAGNGLDAQLAFTF